MNSYQYETCEKCIEIDLKTVFSRAARFDPPCLSTPGGGARQGETGVVHLKS